MTDTRTNPRSTASENFQQHFENLSEADKALITAMMSMGFALLKSVQQVQDNPKQQKGA